MQLEQLQALVQQAQINLNTALRSDLWHSYSFDSQTENQIQQALELTQLANIQLKRIKEQS